MGNSESSVEEHVEQARKTGVCSLKERKLSQVPPAVLSLKSSLRTLDLSVNRLTSLPLSMGDFSLLKTLNVSHNRLTSLPDLGQLKKLETLTADDNSLSSLPDSFSQLKSLKSLHLSHNKLSTFPPHLRQLSHLQFVDLSTNQIAEIPAENVEGLALVELNLNNNSVLRVEENTLQLGGIPPSLLSSSAISLLCTSGNLFQNRELQDLPEYQLYMERYTATKRKAD
ncbi:Leucine-rich repeat-containing protein 57 [Geodia barretti]|uniref:Leucine-rich repeat-containing protein 57 n=1 Tax=Geodia barretti TaxID=519541 RepID=A0AA35X4D1_GEOBA|nr:Leucine-rich repeat-containing protein 57 [Geodia barretti]